MQYRRARIWLATHFPRCARPPVDPLPLVLAAKEKAACTPGPLARVTFATGSSSVGFSPDSQLLKGSGLFLLGAYGVRDAAASAATAAGTPFSFGSARWQPPGPVGGAASSVGVFENRLLGFDAHVPPAHKLPDLSKHVRGGKLRFKVTAPAKSTC